MAIVGMTGRKVTLSILNGGTTTDVLDLGMQAPDTALGKQIIQKGSAAGADLILLNGQEAVTILSIVSVVQGATTYVVTTDYVLGTNTVDWSPAGAEPVTGSFYTVTYTYAKPVSAKAYRRWDAQIITLAAALTGTVNVQSSDTSDVSGGATDHFRNVQSGGVDIALTALKETPLIPIIGRFFRIKSSGAEGAQRDFIVMLTAPSPA